MDSLSFLLFYDLKQMRHIKRMLLSYELICATWNLISLPMTMRRTKVSFHCNLIHVLSGYEDT